jgi:DnaJ-class molecular chaperone
VEYKKYARRIHPDKNHHEKSGVAFRKLKELY